MKYYEIHEETARRANDMNSMRDYRTGSATATYRAEVDDAAELVERQKQKVSAFYHDKLDILLDRYARRLAEYYNAYYRNEAACPSVFISGPANFPVKKKNRQNARRDALIQEWNDVQGILDKIRSIGTGAIDFADPHAREMLEERLRELQSTLDKGKAMNAHYRKRKTMQGFPGIDDERAAEMDKVIAGAYSWAQKPFPDYELTSLRGKIKRTQERLAELDRREAIQDQPESDTELDGVRIVRNVEQNRLQLIFDGKPDDETRAALKAEGFRWSPKNQAWQRQLTDNAVHAARRVLNIPDQLKPTPVPSAYIDSSQEAAPQDEPASADTTGEIQTAPDDQALFPMI